MAIDPTLYGTAPIPILVDLPKLNYTEINTDGSTSLAIGPLFLTLEENGTPVTTSTDSFQPALFQTSTNEQHILHLPANALLEEGHSYTVILQQADGTVPAFMVWSVRRRGRLAWAEESCTFTVQRLFLSLLIPNCQVLIKS